MDNIKLFKYRYQNKTYTALSFKKKIYESKTYNKQQDKTYKKYFVSIPKVLYNFFNDPISICFEKIRDDFYYCILNNKNNNSFYLCKPIVTRYNRFILPYDLLNVCKKSYVVFIFIPEIDKLFIKLF